MLTEELAQQIHRHTLAYFAQHPPHGLVHQVVRVVQVHLSITQAPRWVALLRCLPCAYHAHAFPPKVIAHGQLVQHLSLIVVRAIP